MSDTTDPVVPMEDPRPNLYGLSLDLPHPPKTWAGEMTLNRERLAMRAERLLPGVLERIDGFFEFDHSNEMAAVLLLGRVRTRIAEVLGLTVMSGEDGTGTCSSSVRLPEGGEK